MARKKRLRTTNSNEEYLSQGNTLDPHAELTMNSELPSGGVQVEIEDNEGKKHTRGKTLLSDLWKLPPGHRLVVKENPVFQPIGAEAGVLGQFLGTLARKGVVCSLSHRDWKLLKKVALPNILQIIKSKFIYKAECQKLILKSLNNKWTQYKSTLKSMYFDEHVPIQEMCNKVPECVVPDQWVQLVLYWSSPEGKAVSERNKKARSMQKTTHTAGTKSFARHAHDMQMNDPEKREPNRAEVYLATHKNMDEEVALAIQKQLEEHLETASNSDGRVAWEGDALSQVMGKDTNGCVRGLRLLPDPKNVLDPTRRFQGMDITTFDEKTLVVLVRELIEKLEKVDIRVQELERQASQQKSDVSCSMASNRSGNASPNECLSPSSHASTHNEQGGFLSLLNSNGAANLEIPEFNLETSCLCLINIELPDFVI